MKFVFTDFDGTITSKDTFGPFMLEWIKKEKKYMYLVHYFTLGILTKIGIIDVKKFKKISFYYLFKGSKYSELKSFSQIFFTKFIKKNYNVDILTELSKYQKQKYQIVIITSNLKFIVEPFSAYYGFKLCAVQPEEKNGILTGKISQDFYSGEKKLILARQFAGNDNLANCIAFGDEEGDRFLLNSVGQSVWVKKGKPLSSFEQNV